MSDALYQRRPAIVRAQQWHQPGDHPDVTPMSATHIAYHGDEDRNRIGLMHTHYGPAIVRPGNWIVTDHHGRTAVITNDQFRREYEPAPASRP